LSVRLAYAWRLQGEGGSAAGKAPLGLALRWWLGQLASATTRQALIERQLAHHPH
jgi:hypothetical protein